MAEAITVNKMKASKKMKKQKISKKIENHDSILKAITSFNCKEVLTIEKGNFFYWVRLYKNGKTELFNNNDYFETLEEATKKYFQTLMDLKQKGVNLKFNEV